MFVHKILLPGMEIELKIQVSIVSFSRHSSTVLHSDITEMSTVEKLNMLTFIQIFMILFAFIPTSLVYYVVRYLVRR